MHHGHDQAQYGPLESIQPNLGMIEIVCHHIMQQVGMKLLNDSP